MQSFKQLYLPDSHRRIFYWSGLTALGELKSGVLLATNRGDAQKKLRSQSIIIKKMSSSLGLNRSLRTIDVAQFLQQLSRIMQTGISLIQALQVLSTCQRHPGVATLLAKLQSDLASGASFAETLTQHPRWFDPMVCALIHLGEKTGEMLNIIEKIADQKQKHHQLKQQFKTLLIYPITVISMAGVVTTYLLITVVPQLQLFFQQAHQSLPSTTLVLLMISEWLTQYGILVCGLSIMTSLFLRIAYRYVLPLQYWIDRSLLSTPMLGHIYQAMALTRVFDALALAQQASLPLLDALQWIAPLSGNLCYHRAFLQIRQALQQGDSLGTAMEQTHLFPNLAVQMVSLGENSGPLSVLLTDLAHYYAQSAEDSLQRLSRCVEPSLMLVLGIIIGGLVLSLYLPLIQLGAVL